MHGMELCVHSACIAVHRWASGGWTDVASTGEILESSQLNVSRQISLPRVSHIGMRAELHHNA
jgi:hypothetical protein